MSSESFDAIVIGLGAMGSAACRSLARRGVRVLGVEQFSAVHDRGSSHGRTRICRKAYFEHPNYVPLMHRCYEMWDELSALAGRKLFVRCGLLLAGDRQSELIRGARLARERHGLTIETVAAADAERRFRDFRIPAEFDVLYEPDAGFLWVEDAVGAQLDQARKHGAELRFGEAVQDWSCDAGGASLTTDRGEYQAPRLVWTAGAWSGPLLAQLGVALRVRRMMQLWFAVEDRSAYAAQSSPVFAYELGEHFFYGFPQVDAGTIKVAEHTGGETLEDPSDVDRTLRDADTASVRGFVEAHLPAAGSEIVRHSVCTYTMTPDGHFVVDKHPTCAAVVIAAGFSGHGFKFAPLIGEALADLALEGETSLPIEFLGLDRLRDIGR